LVKRKAASEEWSSAKRAGARKRTGPKKGQDVAAFMLELDHPRAAEAEAVRQIILGADPRIKEAIKWNAPSFYTLDHFATFNLRAPDQLLVIFHTGAKPRAAAEAAVKIDDPAGLLEWLAKDRAAARFYTMKDVTTRRAALTALVRQWVEGVSGGG
jgi:hypothetical protein